MRERDRRGGMRQGEQWREEKETKRNIPIMQSNDILVDILTTCSSALVQLSTHLLYAMD